MTPSLALCTSGVFVLTTIPGAQGIAQLATNHQHLSAHLTIYLVLANVPFQQDTSDNSPQYSIYHDNNIWINISLSFKRLPGYLYSGNFTSLNQGCALLDHDFLAIDGDLNLASFWERGWEWSMDRDRPSTVQGSASREDGSTEKHCLEETRWDLCSMRWRLTRECEGKWIT